MIGKPPTNRRSRYSQNARGSGRDYPLNQADADQSRGLYKGNSRKRVVASIAAALVLVFIYTAVNPFKYSKQLRHDGLALENVDLALEPYARSKMVKTDRSLSEMSALSGFDVGNIFKNYLDHPLILGASNPVAVAKGYIDVLSDKTRTKLSGEVLQNPGGCTGRGPRLLDETNPAPSLDVKLSVLPPTVAADVANHLHGMKNDAMLLSPEHETLCSWDPQAFLPAYPRFSRQELINEMSQPGFKKSEGFDNPSAYSFHDVCVTYNQDSLNKRAQRGLVYFDPSNTKDQRCVPCQNPQINSEWSTTPCGMMWMHQINAQSLKDFQTCSDKHASKIEAFGQRQAPGARNLGEDLRAAIYYTKPVLILNYVKGNPGHQLWDTFFNIVPILMAQETHGVKYFDYIISHQTTMCEESIWLCNVLRHLGVIVQPQDDKEMGNLLPTFSNVMSCFSNAIVLSNAWNRRNPHSEPPLIKWVQQRMRDTYGLPLPNRAQPENERFAEMLHSVVSGSSMPASETSKQRYRMLMYAHHTKGEKGRRRDFENIESFLEVAKEKLPFVDITAVPDFAKLTPEEQAHAFHEADIILMPHGGQFGNIMFVRPGTIIIEVTCGVYSNIATGNTLASSADLYHFVQQPLRCSARTDEGNFDYTFDEDFTAAIRLARDKIFQRKPASYFFSTRRA